jgi:ornithine cyclodeaminase
MTVVVSWEDMSRVLPGLDLLPLMESGFAAYSRGQAMVPPVGELLFPRGEAHIKYGHIAGDRTFAVKVATGFYDNPARGLSSSNGLVLLIDAETGVPAAVLLDEGKLTDIRTAVAGAVAAKWLAPKTVTAIGILGTGIQARLQAEYLMHVTPCRTLYAWGRRADPLEVYRRDMTALGFTVTACATPAEVAAHANLIVTTTPSKEPLLTSGDIRPGTHITAAGADTPDKNEVAPDVFANARVVADSLSQCRTRGDSHHALERAVLRERDIVELGAIIAGEARGRQNDSEITIADLTGVAVQDIKIAQAVYAAIRNERAST